MKNRGLRAAISPPEGKKPAEELTLDLGDVRVHGIPLRRTGTFVMEEKERAAASNAWKCPGTW